MRKSYKDILYFALALVMILAIILPLPFEPYSPFLMMWENLSLITRVGILLSIIVFKYALYFKYRKKDLS